MSLRLIAIILVCLLHVPTAESSPFVGTPDRTDFLEDLWYREGLGSFFVEWGEESPAKSETVKRYIERNAGEILADYNSYSKFFIDSAFNTSYREESIQWISETRSRYKSSLDRFEANLPVLDTLESVSSVESVSSAMSILASNCYNIDFENGNMNDWATTIGYASGAPYPAANIPYGAYTGTFSYASKIQTFNTPGIYDIIVGGTALPVLCPTGGAWTAKIEDFGPGFGLSQIEKSFVVSASKPWIEYKYAVVLEDPGDHRDDDRPFFEVKMFDGSNNEITCAAYKVIAKPPVANFAQVEGTRFYWRDWSSVIIPLDDFVGQSVRIIFRVGDCALGGHMAYAYLDGACLDGTLLIDNSCNPTKTITAPKGFDHYHWTGPAIDGTNYNRAVEVKEAGDYQVHLTTVTGCYTEKTANIVGDCPTTPISCSLSGLSYNVSGCNSNSNTYSVSGTVTVNGISDGYLLAQAGGKSQIIRINGSGPVNYLVDDLQSTGKSRTLELYLFSSKHFSSYTRTCSLSQAYTEPTSCYVVTQVCENCIKGFIPDPTKTYSINTWVKKENATPLEYTYAEPYIKVYFDNGTTITDVTFAPSGDIISEWQRITGEFQIPVGTINVTFEFGTTSGSALFDDIRIYPRDGGISTFVYDPKTLQMKAELNENNYAIFYEYDDEGNLLRVHKETVDGVLTVDEFRASLPKKP